MVPSASALAPASKVVSSPMAMRRSAPASATGGSLTRTDRTSLTVAVFVVELSVTLSVTG